MARWTPAASKHSGLLLMSVFTRATLVRSAAFYLKISFTFLERRHGLHYSCKILHGVLQEMASLEGHCSQTDDAMCSVQERTEALFNKLADEDKVSSEPAGLVAALADLDLRLTGKQVVEVTREILGPTQEYFFEGCFFALYRALAAAAFSAAR